MNFPKQSSSIEENKQPSIENKQPSDENNSQPAQDKPKDADKKEAAPFKFCLPIQNPVDDALKLMKLAHVKKSTTIKKMHEGSGFTELRFKGEFSTGSFWLDRIRRFIPNLLSDLEESRKKKIMDEIDDQAWEEKFQKGESLFIYHGGSGQEKNFGLRLIPKEVQSRTVIRYNMGTIETTFRLAQPFMMLEKTRESFFRDTTKQEIVYLPATYGPKQQEELNQMKIAFFSSTMKGLMIQDMNGKRSLEDRDGGDDNNEDECSKGDPYKQLKS